MAKVYATIGYAETSEIRPGVWCDNFMERSYYGDLTRSYIKYIETDKVNDDIDISNELSIVADTFAYNKFHLMRYVVIGSAKWKVKSIEVAYPRMKLTLGGVYNENTA